MVLRLEFWPNIAAFSGVVVAVPNSGLGDELTCVSGNQCITVLREIMPRSLHPGTGQDKAGVVACEILPDY